MEKQKVEMLANQRWAPDKADSCYSVLANSGPREHRPSVTDLFKLKRSWTFSINSSKDDKVTLPYFL